MGDRWRRKWDRMMVDPYHLSERGFSDREVLAATSVNCSVERATAIARAARAIKEARGPRANVTREIAECLDIGEPRVRQLIKKGEAIEAGRAKGRRFGLEVWVNVPAKPEVVPPEIIEYYAEKTRQEREEEAERRRQETREETMERLNTEWKPRRERLQKDHRLLDVFSAPD